MSTDPEIPAELINAAARAAYDEHYGAGHFDATKELRREIARDDMTAAAPILLAAGAVDALRDMADRIDRGPTFPLPPSVISALIRERADEIAEGARRG
jgi:hypothetical protein